MTPLERFQLGVEFLGEFIREFEFERQLYGDVLAGLKTGAYLIKELKMVDEELVHSLDGLVRIGSERLNCSRAFFGFGSERVQFRRPGHQLRVELHDSIGEFLDQVGVS